VPFILMVKPFFCFISLQLCGCGLLGVGIWLSVSQGNFATFSPSFPSLSAANLVIAIGTVIMVTGFLGCLGAIKENKCLLLSVRHRYFFSLSPVTVALLLFYLNDQCKIALWITNIALGFQSSVCLQYDIPQLFSQ